jgi:tRNA pseudouridine38-40 synthase
MPRYKMIIEYCGTNYSGWQYHEGETTIQGAIETAIKNFCGQSITVTGASRTDAGVHARGQVAHIDLNYKDNRLSAFEIMKAINAHLQGKSVVIVKMEQVVADFHARFDAAGKYYLYRILNRSAPPTLDLDHVWHIRRPLDVTQMTKASKYLLGKHDFSSFQTTGCQAKSPIKTLDRLDIEAVGDEIHFHVEGRSFLYNMVRNMVGTLALAGHDKIEAESLQKILAAKDRRAAGPTAPARGLYLMRVMYE